MRLLALNALFWMGCISLIEGNPVVTPQLITNHMSVENLLKLQQAKPGVDLERRAAKLRNLPAVLPPLDTETTQQTKIRAVKTERPNEDALDLFEVNARTGVEEYMFEGDIDLNDSQLDDLKNKLSGGRSKRQASSYLPKWTNGIVYYYFDSSLSNRTKESVLSAIDYLMSKTCLTFINNPIAANRIRIYNGVGCFSSVGMISGEQDLSLGNGCEVIGTVAHEFSHALGFWHTHMRSDRDTYVTIDTSVVPTDKHHNFNKLTAADMIIHTPYEYGSFMHYGANSFVDVAGGISINPKDSDFTYTMGNRQITFYDTKMINEHYGCSAKCPAATSASCQNGGEPNPRNCAVCNCPSGYGGALCDERPEGCGEELVATNEWQTKSHSVGENGNMDVRDKFTTCNHWIKAPAGYEVQVKITSMYNPQCQYGCPFNGIELKVLADTKPTNPLTCCPEFNNVEYTSKLNPMPIVSYNRYYYSTFSIAYRYVLNGVPVVSPVPTPGVAPPPTSPSPDCIDTLGESKCLTMKSEGYCTNSQPFENKKYNCARTCGLCGQKSSLCADTNVQCLVIKTYGMCSSMTPIAAEFNCAETCGFCSNPV